MPFRAVVLSGGGIDGLFAHGGALQALRRYLGPLTTEVDCWAGASAGALAATMAALGRDGQILRYAEFIRPRDLWQGDRPFRALRRAWRLSQGANLLEPSGLKALLERELPDELLADLPRGRLLIPALCLRRRRTTTWAPEAVGPEIFRQALLGSMAVPFAFPTVKIQHEGQVYELADGGVTQNHPIELLATTLLTAKAAGRSAELIVISILQPPDVGPLPNRGPKRAVAMIGAIVESVMHEFARDRREEMEELGISTFWIGVTTPDLDLEDFRPTDSIAAYQAGFEAVTAAWGKPK